MLSSFTGFQKLRSVLAAACLSCIFMLAASSSAFAANIDKLNGTWTIDVDATIALKGGEKPGEEALAAMKAQADKLRVTIDTRKKTFVAKQDGKVVETRTFSSITEKGDTVTLKQGQKAETYKFLPNGQVLVGPKSDIALKKVSK